MNHRMHITATALCALLVATGVQAWLAGVQPVPATARMESLTVQPQVPASVTQPVDPVVVQADGGLDTSGWSQAAPSVDSSGSHTVSGELLAAYSLAVAASPPACHIPVSLLEAIGQVESGNLAGHQIDASHRVVTAILGPVLDGKPFQAIPDTDAGQWDGNKVWDRAVGPMQLIPSTWRVVGVDMDQDGLRDPQNVYDAAGAAMVYLCANSRDLGTASGVKDAVLSYNHSVAYLNLVLAWKAVYDQTELGAVGALPLFDAWALPTTPAATQGPSGAATTPAGARPTAAARPATKPLAHTAAGTSPAPASPSSSSTSAESSPAPATAGSTPSGSTPSGSTPSDPTTAPDPSPAPDPKPAPDPLPTCPLPSPVDPADPSAPVDPSTPVDPVPVPSGTPTDVPGIGTTETGDPCLLPTDPADPTAAQAPDESASTSPAP
jgi:hypothetical protein